jgi:RimJ/RimL family protein N-acetyltransferase
MEFAITLNDQAVGGTGLRPGTDCERISAEVGYWVGQDVWGRGLATAALKSITGYAFRVLNLHRVFAMVFDGNVASARVLEKAGYLKEGVLRRAAQKEDRILDCLLYAITRQDFDCLHP